MKAYTDIEQSKKLAEMLPLESADMCHNINKMSNKQMPPLMTPYSRFKEFFDIEPTPAYLIPCWSLAALLNIMPDRIDDSHFLTLDKEGKEYCCCYEDINGNSFKHEFADNAIDACVEMIEFLHKENLI